MATNLISSTSGSIFISNGLDCLRLAVAIPPSSCSCSRPSRRISTRSSSAALLKTAKSFTIKHCYKEATLDSKPDNEMEGTPSAENTDRRDVIRKLGRFAAYAAPFTVLAFSQKANAASGHGPGPKLRQ